VIANLSRGERKSKNSRILIVATIVIAAFTPAVPAAAGGDLAEHPWGLNGTSVLLRSDLVGSLTVDPVLFGAVPGTNDWSTSRSDVVVSREGRLTARIRDLILTRDGSNLLPLVSASLVCNGEIVDRTDPVPFSDAGNALISTQVTVPDRCLAPAVLLNPLDRGTVYIAATGQVE
jgi:hypothetical protein